MRRVLCAALALLVLAPPAFGLEENYRFDIPYPYQVTRPGKEQSGKPEGVKKKAVDCSAAERERDAARRKVQELERRIETQQRSLLAQRELIRQLQAELLHKNQVILGLFQQLQAR